MVDHIDWFVDQRVVMFEMVGDVSGDGLRSASQAFIELIESSEAPLVHILVDQSKIGHVPNDLKGVLDASTFLKHPRLGWLIIYGKDDKLIKFMSFMITQVTKIRYRHFDTEVEAFTFLNSVDVTLPDLKGVKD